VSVSPQPRIAAPSGLPETALAPRPAVSAARLSISQTTMVRWSLPEAIEEFRSAGLRNIGVSLDRLRDCGVERAARLLSQAGLHASSLGWVGGFTGAHGHSYDDAVADARAAIRSARDIGADSLIVVPGALCGHIRSHARRLLVEALVELADQATDSQVRLAVQPMHPLFEDEWSFLTSLDDTLDVLSRFNHTHVGMAFGAYHLWQEPRLLERIPEIVPFVASVQLSDWRDPPRCDNDRLLPGDGAIPLAEIIAAFEAAGYRGCYEIEVWSRDLWKREHRSLIRECMLRFAHLLTTPT
jgi:sugar phosphate isomerase/epimerase